GELVIARVHLGTERCFDLDRLNLAGLQESVDKAPAGGDDLAALVVVDRLNSKPGDRLRRSVPHLDRIDDVIADAFLGRLDIVDVSLTPDGRREILAGENRLEIGRGRGLRRCGTDGEAHTSERRGE